MNPRTMVSAGVGLTFASLLVIVHDTEDPPPGLGSAARIARQIDMHDASLLSVLTISKLFVKSTLLTPEGGV